MILFFSFNKFTNFDGFPKMGKNSYELLLLKSSAEKTNFHHASLLHLKNY
ncbi:MAG: hypothetical protein IEMM0006_1227 [bacterium]|nr:MAG: hypothetical protein IEMM0006_1227 [bacterium]